MTTANIKTSVRNYFCAPQWATFFEVHSSTGFAKRSADAVTMSLFPSRGLELYGLEFKASRSDWLRELKQPEKADVICQQCDKWAIVTSDSSVLKEDELPEHWGWYICSGVSLRVKKRPKKNPHKVPVSPEFLAALLRRAAEAIDSAPRSAEKELDSKYSEGWIDGKKANEQEVERAMKKHQELDDKVRAFELETGLKISGGWHMRGGVTAQQFNSIASLLVGERAQGHMQDLRRWHGRLSETLGDINRNFTALTDVLARTPSIDQDASSLNSGPQPWASSQRIPSQTNGGPHGTETITNHAGGDGAVYAALAGD